MPQIIGNVGYNDAFKLRLPRGVWVNRGLLEIMDQCLNKHPKDRPSFGRIVQLMMAAVA